MSTNLKVLIIDPDYPRASNLYGDVFVHTRLKAYPKSWEISVIGYNAQLSDPCDYIWEGVSVYLSPALSEIERRIRDRDCGIIAIHFIQHELMDILLEQNKPLLIFLHGFESTSWRRRVFNYSSPGDFPYLFNYIRKNRHQLDKLRKFVQVANQRTDIHFVFVSHWLQQACEEDLKIGIGMKHIIPNSIDTDRFHFVPKSPKQRMKILVIRSFDARNYANDIMVNTIVELSRKEYFSELSFSIYGEGYLFSKLTSKIKHFKNVTLYNHFVPNESIPAIHREHGIFFCFSRLDSQGVSMCEAMSSGLVTLTSRVAAIPEFVEDGYSGFLTRNQTEIINSMDQLIQFPEYFTKISEQGSRAILEKCSLSKVIPQEVNLIIQLANV